MAQPAQLIIDSIARHRARIDRDPKRRERLRALQRFQIERLRWTYAVPDPFRLHERGKAGAP